MKPGDQALIIRDVPGCEGNLWARVLIVALVQLEQILREET